MYDAAAWPRAGTRAVPTPVPGATQTAGQAGLKEKREYRGVEFCRLCGWLAGHGRDGYAVDYLYRTPACAAGNVVHAPISRNQCRHDSRLDMPFPGCGRHSGMDTPVGAAASRGNPLWSWPCLAIPGCTVRHPACASHGNRSALLIHQKSQLRERRYIFVASRSKADK